jgi:hypothetical protein
MVLIRLLAVDQPRAGLLYRYAYFSEYRIPTYFNCMAKAIGALFAWIMLSTAVHAQILNKAIPARIPAEEKAKIISPMANDMLQRIIADSLNKRAAGYLDKKYIEAGMPVIPDIGSVQYLQQPVKNQFSQYIGNSFGKQHLMQVQQGMTVIKDSARVKQYINDKLRGFYAIRNDVGINNLLSKGAYKNDFKGVTVSAFADNNPGNTAVFGTNLRVADQVMIKNIPVNIGYSNISGQSVWDGDPLNQSLVKFSFDKEAYVKRLNGIVEEKYDLRKYFLKDIDVKSAVKSFTNSRLESIQQLIPSVGEKQMNAFKSLLSSDHIIQLDSLQIRNELLNNRDLGITADDLNPLIAQSQDSLLKTIPAGDSSMKAQLDHMRTAQAARSYLDKVYQLKKDVGEGLQAKAVISEQHVTDKRIADVMDQEESKVRNIKELLPLNGLQKLLLSAKQVDIGNIAANGSKGGVQNLFMSGIQTSFLSKGNFLMLGAGKRVDGGMMQDLNFNSSLDPGVYNMQFLQTGKGDISDPHSHVAVVNANSKSDNRRQYTNLNLPRNTFVGAFSEDVSVGKYGRIAAQLSKSNNQFKNSATGNDPLLASKAAALSLFNDFWETLSVGVDYNGQVDEWQLTQRAYISYSGLGYNNPASPGAGRGTIRYGLKLKRSWYKNKVTLGVRTDFQDISASAVTNSKWKNRQFAIDGRWKMNRKLSFDAHFNQSAMKSVGGKITGMQYLTRQVSVGSQMNGSMLSIPYNSNVMLGYQQIDVLPQHSTLLNLNINHNLVINTHVLSVNLFYNKDIKGQAVYANLLTVESGWTYQVLRQLQCSSGITYLDNKAVVQQIGFKQTMSTNILPKLNVNMYIDCRKNLLNTPQNYLFGNFRSELAFSYLLN